MDHPGWHPKAKRALEERLSEINEGKETLERISKKMKKKEDRPTDRPTGEPPPFLSFNIGVEHYEP